MLKRRHITAGPGGHSLRSSLAAATEPLRALAWAVEERLVWTGADLLRGVAEAARWPLERLAWMAERRLVWPLREQTASWSPPGRAAGAATLAAVAMGAGALGVVAASGGDPDRERVAAPVAVATPAHAAPTRAERPSGPILQGAPPNFGVGDGVGVAKQTSGATSDAAAEADAGATAGASSKKPVPAGPVAMKVARRFAEAFVFYEVGERPARAATVFSETATPQLATALAERPPRQPAEGKAPKAKVLNLVPGPRAGKAYTVSASLLRVGVTSELRLEMRRRDGAWVVTDVRG